MTDELNAEKNLDEVPEDKKGIVDWIKAHKKQLIFVGVSIPVLIGIVLGLENKESLTKLWNELKEEIKKADIYSPNWFANATKAELDLEREKVRLAYCSSGDDFKKACDLQNLLFRFDKELSKRAWGGEIPHPPSIHREHGTNLWKPD